MKPITVNRWLLALMVVMCIALGVGSAWAQPTGLGQVGPLNAIGYPSFISDKNALALEPCLVSPVDPTAPVVDPCALTGTLPLGDAQPIVFISNFPTEFFYFNATALFDIGGNTKNRAFMLTAVEGGFTPPLPPTLNQQVAFIRTRLRIDGGLVAGQTYRATHPYGVIEFTSPDGTFKQTTDIGCLAAPCGTFQQLLTAVDAAGHATVGPYLTAVAPPPAGYIGNPNVGQLVTGSPTGNNFFRIERIDPATGGVLAVVGETDQFNLTGKLYTGPSVAPTLTIDRTTYAKNTSGTTVNVFAYSVGAASVVATVSGSTITLAGDGTGRYFGQASVPGATAGSPVNVTATNTSGSITMSSTLVDDVIIDSATYNVGTLTVQAHSTDVTASATLTVQDDRTPPLTLGAPIASGGVFTLSTQAPPGYVAVLSSLGGRDARTVDLTPGGSQVATTLGLVSNLNPSELGQPVTFTATIVAAGTTSPTGTITFKDGATVLGTSTVTSKVTFFTAPSLAIGSHTITATYNGDAAFAGSTSNAVIQVVNKATVVITANGSPNPSAVGQLVILSASVTAATVAAGIPGGTVTFSDGGTALGAGPVSSGLASINVSTLTVGSHLITATYSGDASFKAAAAIFTQTVASATSTTTVTATPSPVAKRAQVTLTATVTPSPASAGGIVTFTSTNLGNNQTTVLGNATVGTDGVATFKFAAPNQARTFRITASYSGNANLTASSSTTDLVVQ